MYADALTPGDEIRVIAPAQSKRSDMAAYCDAAQQRLEALDYVISYGSNISSALTLGVAPVEKRVQDFHDAYADPSVKAVIALHGGWFSNDLLPHIDWELITANPKPFIGNSDLTVLLNAIYAKTGLVGYLCPNFDKLGFDISQEYTLEHLRAVLQKQFPHEITHSDQWADPGDKNMSLQIAKPWTVLQPGMAQGVLLGGNLGSFYLLQGTPYQPLFQEDFILALEDDDEAGECTAREFWRRLESLLQLSGVRDNLKGVLIGRFQPSSRVTAEEVSALVLAKLPAGIPVVSEVDFGHTLPAAALPIGGTVIINAPASGSANLVIL